MLDFLTTVFSILSAQNKALLKYKGGSLVKHFFKNSQCGAHIISILIKKLTGQSKKTKFNRPQAPKRYSFVLYVSSSSRRSFQRISSVGADT